MATLARVLAFGVVLTLASALDQWGLFCCPDFRKEAVGIPYHNTTAMRAYYDAFNIRGAKKMIAAAESKDSAAYTCVYIAAMTPVDYVVEYQKSEMMGLGFIKLDTDKFILKGTLPKGLLGIPDEVKVRTWTIVSDKDGIVVMKTCRDAFLSHYTSTYVFVDQSSNTQITDFPAFIAGINKTYKINAVAVARCEGGR